MSCLNYVICFFSVCLADGLPRLFPLQNKNVKYRKHFVNKGTLNFKFLSTSQMSCKAVRVLKCVLSVDTVLKTGKILHIRSMTLAVAATNMIRNPYLWWPYEFLIADRSGRAV